MGRGPGAPPHPLDPLKRTLRVTDQVDAVWIMAHEGRHSQRHVFHLVEEIDDAVGVIVCVHGENLRAGVVLEHIGISLREKSSLVFIEAVYKWQ